MSSLFGVVIRATYGWYWAVALLREAEFWVHLASMRE
jgi:hypothetical protein